MGSCMSAPTPNVEVNEEEKARSREIDKQLKEVSRPVPAHLADC